MSNVVVTLPRKERLRAETEKLVAAYDGPITKDRAGLRTSVHCHVCNLRSMVSVAHAMQFQQHCRRCHSADVTIG
jgi:hypothetical protein